MELSRHKKEWTGLLFLGGMAALIDAFLGFGTDEFGPVFAGAVGPALVLAFLDLKTDYIPIFN